MRVRPLTMSAGAWTSWGSRVFASRAVMRTGWETTIEESLESVSQDSKVKVLRLDPLTDSDVIRIVNDRLGATPMPRDSSPLPEESGVDGLLRNPQSLIMLAEVVAEGGKLARESLGNFREGLFENGPRAQ